MSSLFFVFVMQIVCSSVKHNIGGGGEGREPDCIYFDFIAL